MTKASKFSGGFCDAKNYKQSVKRGASKTSSVKYFVEGEYYTAQELADKLDVALTTAHKYMRKCAQLPGPTTWDKIRSVAKPK
jgi:hypothetical protein